MSVVLPTAPVGGVRTSGLIPASSDFSQTLRVWVPAPTPLPPGNFNTFTYRGNDPAIYTQGYTLTQAVLGNIYLQGNAPPAPIASGPFLTAGWHTIANSFDATSFLHTVYLDYFHVFSLVLDITGETFTHELFGTDTYPGDWGAGKYARLRQWNAVLTQTEFGREANQDVAQRTANLWGDWPLATDLLDISGNNRHWAVSP